MPHFKFRRLAFAAATAASLFASQGANAIVVSGSSTGYGESINLSVLNVVNVNSLEPSGATGTAPAPYSESASTLSVNLPGGILSTGLLNGEAASNVDGGLGSRSASASGSVNELTANIVNALLLDATTLGATAQVSGDYNAFSVTGGSVIEDLDLTALGTDVDVNVDFGPNTVLFDSLGLRIVANEQITTGDGISSRGFEVNALHIFFDDFAAGLNVIDGDIILGHAEAELTAQASPIPLPAAVWLLGSGLAAFGISARRKSAA